MKTIEERLNDIECVLLDLERTIEDLNNESIRQSRLLDKLQREHNALKQSIENNVKPLADEVPPPHY